MKPYLFKSILALSCGAALTLATPASFARPSKPNAADKNADSEQEEKGDQGRRHGGRKHSIEQLTTELNLTAEQQAAIKPILEATRAQAKEIRGNAALSKEERRPQMKQLHQATREKINALLTPEQQQKFAASKKGHGRHGVKNG